MPIVKAEKITYHFPNDRRAGISDISFEAHEGEVSMILGGNASGKSALVHLISALALPEAGEISVCGLHPGEKTDLREIRKKCGVVLDDMRSRFFTDTPGEELRFALRCAGLSAKTAGEKINNIKTLTGLSAFEKIDFSDLGELALLKTAIAVCLVTEPELIIFDNSASLLHGLEKEEFFALIRKIAATGTAVVVTGSSCEDAVRADRVIVLCGGKKVGEGTAREILTDMELLKKADLEPPFAVKVYYDLLDAEVRLPEIPLTMDELVKEICR